jgi:hypothetical protein
MFLVDSHEDKDGRADKSVHDAATKEQLRSPDLAGRRRASPPLPLSPGRKHGAGIAGVVANVTT